MIFADSALLERDQHEPVSSNMMTTSDTVIRVTPPRTAAAPTMAYRPGVMQESL